MVNWRSLLLLDGAKLSRRKENGKASISTIASRVNVPASGNAPRIIVLSVVLCFVSIHVLRNINIQSCGHLVSSRV
eukprot:g7343.t1